MSTVELSSCDHGVVAKVKRCIMERDLYPRRWGMGPVATEKKKMKESGKLDKYGRPNEQTPAKWNAEYQDFNLTVNGVSTTGGEQAAIEAQPVKEGITGQSKDTTSRDEVLAAPAVAGDGSDVKDATMEDLPKDKKRKREGETAEEKAERKKKKAEKKEKKEKRKSKSKADSSDSE